MALRTRIGRIPAFEPNWNQAPKVVYEFKTAVVESYDGTEQRSAIRQTPRVSLSYAFLGTAERANRHLADLATGWDIPFVVPMRWRKTRTTALLGINTLTLETVPFWCVPGARLVVVSETHEEAIEVASVDGSTITAAALIDGAFPVGSSVYPAFLARVEEKSSFSTPTAAVIQGDLSFDFLPGQNVIAAPAIAPAQFEGFDVFDAAPNWQASPRLGMEIARREFDPGFGRTFVDTPIPFHYRTDQFAFRKFSAAAVEDLIAFFLRQLGKRGQFWVPTRQKDIVAAEPVSAGATTLVVAGADFHAAFAGHKVYNVAAQRVGTTYQPVRIASVAINGGGDSEITFAAPLPEAVPAGGALSWCPLRRFATDRLEVEWITSEIAEATMAFRTLPNEAP